MANEWSTDIDESPEMADGTPTEAYEGARSHGVDERPDGRSETPSSGAAAIRADAGGGMTGEDELHRSAVDAVDGLLDEVELALARLDDGTYGRCEECGELIDDGRLAALPIIRTCGRCDPDRGAGAGSPTETPSVEPILADPFVALPDGPTVI